jgi:hypothetical protein
MIPWRPLPALALIIATPSPSTVPVIIMLFASRS